MDHFTIFQDFYRVIAEMTEEEIVSAISNGTYRETVEDVRRIFAEQGEKAANEKKIELPEITFSANYRGGRSNATLVKYLGYIVVDIDHQTQEALARILALAKKCAHTRIAFISPKGMGLKIVVRVCRTDGTLPETIQEIEDFHHAAYHKIASFYAQLCGVEVDTSGQDVSRTCLFSYDPDIYFNPDATAVIVEQPPMFFKSQKKKRASGKKKKTTTPDNNPLTEQVALNYHSSHASLMVTLNYYHNKSEKYVTGNRNNYLHCLACMYNRYGVPQEEAAAFIKSQFTDLPEDEMDALIGSAYGHNEEFDTRKLNSTQKRMLQIEQHIKENYDTRYNEVLHIMEYRRRKTDTEQPEPFHILDEMMENSIWMEINELGYSCTVKTIQNLIYSDFSITYHPIREYLDSLPEWDGTDYIGILANSVHTSHQKFWVECLERYLVGMCAAATQDDVVNHTVLLLCSEIQNIGQEVLHDTTGNRRFLCFHVDSMEFIKINYAQLYAQIKYLLNKPGYQYWFTQSENSRIEENNEDFIFHSSEEELVLTHIRKPERFEKVHYLTVTEIAELIRERTGYQYSHGTKAQLGKVMSKHGFEFHKGKNGRRYTVFIIDTELTFFLFLPLSSSKKRWEI